MKIKFPYLLLGLGVAAVALGMWNARLEFFYLGAFLFCAGAILSWLGTKDKNRKRNFPFALMSSGLTFVVLGVWHDKAAFVQGGAAVLALGCVLQVVKMRMDKKNQATSPPEKDADRPG